MIAPRFLIDENLSPSLADIAHRHDFAAVHVNYRGLRTRTDEEILEIVRREDWVLVTNNAVEFRGRYRRLDVHPGVVFLVPAIARAGQQELFRAALVDVGADPDLVNKALDVDFAGPSRISVRRYDLP